MSDVARTVLIVTNDLDFSGQVSEHLLRAGVRTIRFARFANALELTQRLAPELVLIHAPREHVAAGWACYQMIQSDTTLRSIVALISVPASALIEHAAAAPAQALAATHRARSNMLTAQISALLTVALPARLAAGSQPSEHAFPIGRDDV